MCAQLENRTLCIAKVVIPFSSVIVIECCLAESGSKTSNRINFILFLSSLNVVECRQMFGEHETQTCALNIHQTARRRTTRRHQIEGVQCGHTDDELQHLSTKRTRVEISRTNKKRRQTKDSIARCAFVSNRISVNDAAMCGERRVNARSSLTYALLTCVNASCTCFRSDRRDGEAMSHFSLYPFTSFMFNHESR